MIPGSRGEAYNITSQGRITQQEFLDMFADALAFPRVTRHIPYRLAYTGGFLLEMQGRLLRQAAPPRITRYGAWLLGRYLSYSTEKGADPAGLAARPRISREHRPHDPMVPRPRARQDAGRLREDSPGSAAPQTTELRWAPGRRRVACPRLRGHGSRPMPTKTWHATRPSIRRLFERPYERRGPFDDQNGTLPAVPGWAATGPRRGWLRAWRYGARSPPMPPVPPRRSSSGIPGRNTAC